MWILIAYDFLRPRKKERTICRYVRLTPERQDDNSRREEAGSSINELGVLFLLYLDKLMWLRASIFAFIVLFIFLAHLFFLQSIVFLSFLLNCTCSSCLDIEE